MNLETNPTVAQLKWLVATNWRPEGHEFWLSRQQKSTLPHTDLSFGLVPAPSPISHSDDVIGHKSKINQTKINEFFNSGIAISSIATLLILNHQQIINFRAKHSWIPKIYGQYSRFKQLHIHLLPKVKYADENVNSRKPT